MADWDNNRIQVFTDEGKFLQSFTVEEKVLQSFTAGEERCGEEDREWYPHGVAVDSQWHGGGVYVSECWYQPVLVFTLEGKFVTSFGSEGSTPSGLAADSNGVCYVCDKVNGCIQLFSITN